MDGFTNEVYQRGGYEIIIGDDFIRIWFDDEHHQDIVFSEADAEKIRAGADPVYEGWEDGAGNLVCKANSVEAKETTYAVIESMNDLSGEWTHQYATAEEAIKEAKSAWNHLTAKEQSKQTVIAAVVAKDYFSESPESYEPEDILWNSEEQAEVQQSVYFRIGEHVYEIVAKVAGGNQDPWEVVCEHDKQYGTDFFDRLTSNDLTGDRADIENAIYIETEDEVEWPEVASMIVTLRADGRSSVKATVTELAERIGADVGEQVRITMERL